MAKVMYTGKDGSVVSGGVRFQKGKPYEVTDKVAKFLKEAFGEDFYFVEAPKAPEPVVVEEAEAPKPKPRAKRAARPKKVIVVDDDNQ